MAQCDILNKENFVHLEVNHYLNLVFPESRTNTQNHPSFWGKYKEPFHILIQDMGDSFYIKALFIEKNA